MFIKFFLLFKLLGLIQKCQFAYFAVIVLKRCDDEMKQCMFEILEEIFFVHLTTVCMK